MNQLLGNPQISQPTIDRYNAYNPHPNKDMWIPHPIPDEELPVVLPLDLGNYKPAGKSPLEDHHDFRYYQPIQQQTNFVLLHGLEANSGTRSVLQQQLEAQ
jgi:hypothetical protein